MQILIRFVSTLKTLVAFTLLAAMPQLSLAASDAPLSRVEFLPIGVPESIGIKGIELSTANGNVVRYYVRAAPSTNSPVMIFVPGSGCDGAIHLGADGHAKAGPEIFAIQYSKDISVVVLEAPGVPRQYDSQNHGSAEGCPSTYLKYSSYKARLATYEAVIADVKRSEWMGSNNVTFFGISEGVNFAASLAAAAPETAGVTLVSGFGPQQIFDDLHLAMGTWIDESKTDAQIIRHTRETMQDWMKIFRDPDNTEKYYRGHPYARWSSTGLQSSLEAVLKLPRETKVFLVQGGKDVNSSPAGFEFGLSTLLAQRRHFAFQFIPCANHGLMCEADHGEPKNLATVIHRSIDWQAKGKIDYDDVIVVEN